jgi:hypothetical protein
VTCRAARDPGASWGGAPTSVRAASDEACVREALRGLRVAIRWIAEGTHTGPLGAVPPTGRRVRIDGLLFDRVADGRVVERWEQWDQPALLRQLGLA